MPPLVDLRVFSREKSSQELPRVALQGWAAELFGAIAANKQGYYFLPTFVEEVERLAAKVQSHIDWEAVHRYGAAACLLLHIFSGHLNIGLSGNLQNSIRGQDTPRLHTKVPHTVLGKIP